MAAPSLHVICGFAGGSGNTEARQALFCDPIWSKEPDSGVATIKAADGIGNSKPVFRITCAIDGPTDIYVKSGDKLAWVAA